MSYQSFFKRFLLVVVTLLALLGFWYLQSTLMLAFLSLIIAVGLSLPVRFLQKRGWRYGWAVAVSTGTFLLVSSLLVLILLPTLLVETGKLISAIPSAIQTGIELYENIRTQNEWVARILPSITESINSAVPADVTTQLQEFISGALETGVPILLSGLGFVASTVANVAFLLFIAIFFLVDPFSYVKASLFLVPESYHVRLLALWNELYRTLTTWLKAQFTSVTITVVLVWLVLGVLLGMPNPLTVAIIAGFATFIPNVGAFLPLIPIFIFNLAGDPTLLLYVVPAYLAIQLVESNVITPSIIGGELNIPSGALMLFQIIAGTLLGSLGILLAVPLLAVMITTVREIYSYDILGLRRYTLELTSNEAGQLMIVPPADQPPSADHVEVMPPAIIASQGANK